jgi:probable addiction module antidote protein
MPKRKSEFRNDLLADLADPQEAARYFNAAAEDSEEMAFVALRDIAEANRGMAKVAKDAGVAREAVYRMLSESGNPAYRNLSAILKSVGLKIEVSPIQRSAVSGQPSARGPRKTRLETVRPRRQRSGDRR